MYGYLQHPGLFVCIWVISSLQQEEEDVGGTLGTAWGDGVVAC